MNRFQVFMLWVAIVLATGVLVRRFPSVGNVLHNRSFSFGIMISALWTWVLFIIVKGKADKIERSKKPLIFYAQFVAVVIGLSWITADFTGAIDTGYYLKTLLPNHDVANTYDSRGRQFQENGAIDVAIISYN